MLAKMGAIPEGDEWAYEIKWDGVRALGYAEDGSWRMTNRRGDQIADRYPELQPLGEALAGRSAVLDGEVVALGEDGTPSFQLIQRRMGPASPQSVAQRVAHTPVHYFAFDLLHLDGESTRDLPYVERRALLDGLDLNGGCWQAPRSHDGPGADLFEAAGRQGLEGVVAKRRESPYRPGKRSGEWVKARVWKRQEFVIGGHIPGEGRREAVVGSLLVGYHDPEGKLTYAGRVGSGLNAEHLSYYTAELAKRRRPDTPFDIGGPTGPKAKLAVFCEPELVCEVAWSEWTNQGTLRQPSFKGVRDDKDPRDVVREM
jgi:bifunctional non-homologous end joining protein LigD